MLEEIRRRYPKVKVVMLSASTTPDLIEGALRRGASAYVLKTVDPSDLPSTLRQVAGGTVFSTVGATEPSTPSGAKAAGLTDREIAILTELAKGKSNDEIAKELWVTQQTVKFHLTNVYRKLGAKNRADAVRQAYQLGLIERPLGRRVARDEEDGPDEGRRHVPDGLHRDRERKRRLLRDAEERQRGDAEPLVRADEPRATTGWPRRG